MAQATKQSIIMRDGRAIGFGERQQCVKEVLRDADGAPLGVRFSFRNGDTTVLEVKDLPAATVAELVVHGIKQKVGDEGSKEKVTSAQEFADQAYAMAQRLLAGTAFTRLGGERANPDLDLAQALSLWKGDRTVDEALKFLKDKSKAQKQALSQVAGIKAILDRIAQERAADIDGEAIVAGWE